MNIAAMSPQSVRQSLRQIWARALVSVIGLAEDYWKDGGKPLPVPPPPQPLEIVEEKPKGPVRWHADRCQIMQTMWGEGEILPSGGAMTDALVAPLGLNKEMSVLDISAGMGSLARKLADEFNTYVTGLEQDAVVASRGMEMSVNAGKSKHASVEPYDPATFSSERHYDCIIARELFYRVADKKKLLKSVVTAMKPRGQAVFTDYILENNSRNNPAVAAWLALETDASPLSMAEMVKTCSKLGLDVRINEDQTQAYRREVLRGLLAFVGFLRKNKPDRETAGLIMLEVEIWIRRAAAMEQGLQFCRFYAIKG